MSRMLALIRQNKFFYHVYYISILRSSILFFCSLFFNLNRFLSFNFPFLSHSLGFYTQTRYWKQSRKKGKMKEFSRIIENVAVVIATKLRVNSPSAYGKVVVHSML